MPSASATGTGGADRRSDVSGTVHVPSRRAGRTYSRGLLLATVAASILAVVLAVAGRIPWEVVITSGGGAFVGAAASLITAAIGARRQRHLNVVAEELAIYGETRLKLAMEMASTDEWRVEYTRGGHHRMRPRSEEEVDDAAWR